MLLSHQPGPKHRRRSRWARLAWGIGIPVVSIGVVMASIRPSNDRDWKPDHARLPRTEFSGDLVTIHGIRDFRSQSPTEVVESHTDASFDLAMIESVWLILSVFHETERRGPAHAMLSFGFSDGRYLVISVEARKEVGEGYSPWLGLLRKYELIYVIGDERDLILTRAVHREDNVYLYPIRTTPDRVRELFVDMLRQANALHAKPKWYNTLTDNCTTKLRDHVNAIAPGRIPPSWRLLLPGYADELIEGLGLLDADESLATVRRRYWINERAEQAEFADDFSQQIRSN